MNGNEQIKLFGGGSTWSLSMVYDKETGTYFVPWFEDFPVHDPKGWREWLQTVKKGEKPVLAPEPIAILDTGVLSHHPILQPRVIEAVDFTGEGPEDHDGHGTIGAILAVMSCANAPMLSVKVLTNDGAPFQEQIDRIAEGIYWATSHGAKIINLSLGHPRGCEYVHGICNPEKLCNAIQDAFNHGSLAIIAAEAKCPGECQHVLTAGLWDQKERKVIANVPPKSISPIFWDERSVLSYELWIEFVENTI